MSRSNYSDDYDEQFPNASALFSKSVENAIGGRRGQAFLKELIEALDALPEKELVAETLESAEGQVCAIGAVGKKRGVDMSQLNPEDYHTVGETFGIARTMAQEIVFQNDEVLSWYRNVDETPEDRWTRMRHWAVSNLKATSHE